MIKKSINLGGNMEKEAAMPKAKELLGKSKFVYLGTVNEKNEPEIRMMMVSEVDGLEVWLVTNKSSRKTGQIKNNPATCVYVGDIPSISGIKLIGQMEVIDDMAVKESKWSDDFKEWYKEGAADSEYTLLKFVPSMMYFHEGMDYCDCEI